MGEGELDVLEQQYRHQTIGLSLVEFHRILPECVQKCRKMLVI